MYSGTEKPSPVKVIDEEIGTREVTIQWDNTASHITEYRVYLNGELVDYLSPQKNSYTFDFLQLNTTYNYEIRAFNINGASLIRGTFKTKKDDYARLIPIYGIIL